jgi:ribose transport system permease protein
MTDRNVRPRRRLRRALRATGPYRPVMLILLALIVVFAATQSQFMTSANIKTMLVGDSLLWIVSVGMTFVLISGGVDLSVGVMISLCGFVLYHLLGLGLPPLVAVVLTVLAGAVIGGLLNGALIGRLGLSFFVVTLASMIALTGVVNLWSGTNTVFVNNGLVSAIGLNQLLGIPVPIWIMAVVFAVGLYVQRRTYFGRDVYAVGGNPTAARLSGIRVSRTLIIVYGISGACAGLASLIAVGRIGAASPDIDTSIALNAAAAVLVGGTSLTGGSGDLTGTAFGALFIGTLQDGLNLAGMSSFWQQVITGVILLAAILGDRLSLRTVLVRRRGSAATPAH